MDEEPDEEHRSLIFQKRQIVVGYPGGRRRSSSGDLYLVLVFLTSFFLGFITKRQKPLVAFSHIKKNGFNGYLLAYQINVFRFQLTSFEKNTQSFIKMKFIF